MKKSIQFLTLCLLSFVSFEAMSYSQSCQLVAQMAGKQYDARPFWFASLLPVTELKEEMDVDFVERNGAWFVYEGAKERFGLDGCAPKEINKKDGVIGIVPVLYNREAGKSAVINGIFVVKVYRVVDLDVLPRRYGFKKISILPNRFTAIYGVRPQKSYDRMIEQLDQDRDIEFVVPVLSEPD